MTNNHNIPSFQCCKVELFHILCVESFVITRKGFRIVQDTNRMDIPKKYLSKYTCLYAWILKSVKLPTLSFASIRFLGLLYLQMLCQMSNVYSVVINLFNNSKWTCIKDVKYKLIFFEGMNPVEFNSYVLFILNVSSSRSTGILLTWLSASHFNVL